MRPNRTAARTLALVGAGVLLLGVGYRALLTLGTRYGSLEQEVGNWLMAPGDQAPVIVVGLAGWLAWRRWPRLAALPPRPGPSWAAGACLIAGVAIAAWASLVGAPDLEALSLIATTSGLLLLQWGPAGLRVMWVPLVFLLFCLPIPAPLLVTLLWKLRLATADYAGWILYVLGAPAFVSGDQIIRASQKFQVIEGCSGLRSMETLTMLTVLMIDLFHRRGWHAALLLVAAPIVAFVMNGFRVLTLIMNPHAELAEVHSAQGIAILLVGLLTLYGLDVVIEAVRRRRGTLAPAPAPERREGQPPDASDPIAHTRPLPALLVVGAVLAILSLWSPRWDYPPLPTVEVEAVVEQAMGGPGRVVDVEAGPESHYFLGSVRYRRKAEAFYPHGLTGTRVFVATGDRRDRRTSILSPVTGVPGSGWLVRDTWDRDVDGRRVRVSLVEKGVERRLSYHWYEGRDGLLLESLRSSAGFDRSPFSPQRPYLTARISTTTGLEEDRVEAASQRLDEAFRKLDPHLRAATSGAGEPPTSRDPRIGAELNPNAEPAGNS